MCDGHITAWLRRARDQGRLPNRVYIGLLEEHVEEVCASCRQEAETYARGGGASLSAEPRTGEEWQRAAEELEELLALPAAERVGAVRRARRRFRSPALARLLVDRSFACLPHDPQRSLDFATLALAVAEASGRPGMGEAHALALAHQGNALRALGRLPEAGRCFERARALVRHGVAVADSREVIADIQVYATLACCEGIYYRELGQWEAAEERLNRAALFWTVAGDLSSINGVALSLAELYVRSGNVPDALQAVTNLLKHLSQRKEPKLYWITRFNYACFLAEADLCETAQKELRACLSSPGFPRDAFMDRRMQWLGGRIDYELGDLAAAEPKLAAVRAGYLEEGSGINMALASLDLALVYLAQGRTAELKQTAEEMTLIFGANDVHGEAMAALILFQEAVRQEQITAAYLGRLRKYLDRSRHQPGVAFEKPS